MGLRGAKSKFTDAACPNEDCDLYGQAGRGNIAGNGGYRTNNDRIQKYVCRSCGRTFSDRTNTAFCDLGTKNEKVVLGLKMQLEGMGVRATARTLGVHQDTVAPWNKKAAEHCLKVEEAVLKDADADKVEADDMWTFVQKNAAGRRPRGRRHMALESVRSPEQGHNRSRGRRAQAEMGRPAGPEGEGTGRRHTGVLSATASVSTRTRC